MNKKSPDINTEEQSQAGTPKKTSLYKSYQTLLSLLLL